MSDARPELRLRQVVLPWAQPDGAADDDDASGRVRDEALAVKVSRERLSIQRRGDRDLPERSRQPKRQGPDAADPAGQPALQAAPLNPGR